MRKSLWRTARVLARHQGFTLIELLVVASLTLIIAIIATLNLSQANLGTNLRNTASQVVATLREAQTDALAQKGGVPWGVHFANTATSPFFALFDAASYSTSAVVSQYPLGANVAYMSSTLAQGATLDVIFSQASGLPSTSATIELYLPSQTSITPVVIFVNQAGAVSD